MNNSFGQKPKKNNKNLLNFDKNGFKNITKKKKIEKKIRIFFFFNWLLILS